MSPHPQTSSGTAEALLAALRALDRPAPAAKLRRKGLDLKTLDGMLQALCDDGRAFRWPKGKATAYWHTSPEAYAAERVMAIAGERATDRKKLASATARACFGRVPAKTCDVIIRGLVQSDRLTELPGPGGPKAQLLFATGRTEAYLRALADYVSPFLARVAASPDQLHRAMEGPASGQAAVDQVLGALLSLQTEPGAHVAVRDLRRHEVVAGLSKSAFDAAVLQLADAMKVDLAAHDDVYHLTPEAREELVFDSPNKYYVAIAIRI